MSKANGTSSALSLIGEEVVPCFINGKIVHTGKTYDVIDPHDPTKQLHKVSCVSAEEAKQAVEAAKAAFPAWKKTSSMERRDIFLKAAAIAKSRHEELAALESSETTSSFGWAMFDCSLLIQQLEEVAACATSIRGEIAATGPGQRAYIQHCPYGVVFGMAPWNAPFVLGGRAVTNPIMGGNTTVLKTSEFSPRVHIAIAEILTQAGLPAGVLNVIHVDPKDAPTVVESVIAHSAVGKVNFTGSTRVGQIIAEVCGRHLKPCTLELGGKAPLIILPDADLDLAVSAASFGTYFHSGQICMATNATIVHSSIYEQFKEKLVAKVASLKAAPEGAPLRGLFSAASATRIDSLVKDATAKGAKVISGEWKVEHNLVQPTILEGVTPEMKIYSDEHFAPVSLLIPYNTVEEALVVANSSDYGLAASVYGKSEAEAFKVAERIDSGMVHINGGTIHDAQQMPHGGWKKSGWGRFNGSEGIKEFTQIRVITVNDPHPYPL